MRTLVLHGMEPSSRSNLALQLPAQGRPTAATPHSNYSTMKILFWRRPIQAAHAASDFATEMIWEERVANSLTSKKQSRGHKRASAGKNNNVHSSKWRDSWLLS